LIRNYFDATGKIFQNSGRFVGRTVVYDNHRKDLLQHLLQYFAQRLGIVVCRDDYADG